MTIRLAVLILARLIPRFFAAPLYQPLYQARNTSASPGDASASWPQLSFCPSMFPVASANLPSTTCGSGAEAGNLLGGGNAVANELPGPFPISQKRTMSAPEARPHGG